MAILFRTAVMKPCPVKRRLRATILLVSGLRAQLKNSSFICLNSVKSTSVVAFPDLHPGKYGPVGVAVASTAIRPSLIGNDIGCGMALFRLSLKERKLNIERATRSLRRLADDDYESRHERLVDAGLGPDVAPFSLGTVGGGNHFCELLGVDDVFVDGKGISKGDLFLLVHSGSRSLERPCSQVCRMTIRCISNRIRLRPGPISKRTTFV